MGEVTEPEDREQPFVRSPPPSGRPDDVTVALYALPTEGDFEEFYEREWRSVVGLALVLTGDRTAAEDIAQEAFATAYRDWNRVGAYDRPGAFVRRVVANRATSRGRRLTRENRALRRLAGRRQETSLPPEIDETWALVRRLPRRQAQVVALTYLSGLTLAEAADVMEISVETAKTHLARARTALSQELALPDAPLPPTPPPSPSTPVSSPTPPPPPPSPSTPVSSSPPPPSLPPPPSPPLSDQERQP